MLAGPAIGLALVCAVCGLAACGSDASHGRPAAFEVELTGKDCAWTMRYPGPDGRLGTSDDVYGKDDLFLPAGTPARVHLRSKDYAYVFSLPALGKEEVAVPDMEFDLELGPLSEGEYELKGDPLCGLPRKKTVAHLRVRSAQDFPRLMSPPSEP
jgi:cytochrome c oxidase subunit 2